MLQATLVTTMTELEQILELQKANLINNLDKNEMKEQGFVTLHHDIETLKKMHAMAPSVIVKDNDTVVAYSLTMLRECRQFVPDLEPMFKLLDKLTWEDKPLNNYSFYVMGQVCIAKKWRGKGIFEQLYLYHKKIYQPRFDLFVTEISINNHRSIRAHNKLGFKTIHTHRDELDEWAVVAWNWN